MHHLHDVPYLSTFDAVAAFYEKATQWPRKPHDLGPEARALGSNAKRYSSIRPITTEHGDGFAMRYHDTDVVTWTRQGERETVSVKPWLSLSTQTFANNLTPGELSFMFDDRMGRAYFVHHHSAGARVYMMPVTQTFVRNRVGSMFEPVNPEPYEFIDRQSPLVLTELKCAGFYDFHKWLIAVMSFDQRVTRYAREEGDPALRDAIDEADNELHLHGVRGLLADPNKWMHLRYATHFIDLKNSHSVVARIENIMHGLRRCILDYANLPLRKHVGWVTPEEHVRQLRYRRGLRK